MESLLNRLLTYFQISESEYQKLLAPVSEDNFAIGHHFKDIDKCVEVVRNAIKEKIKEKESNLVGQMASQGTTPRQLTDLIGSLCDLTSGSGDKGTPIVLVQGYFDNYISK